MPPHGLQGLARKRQIHSPSLFPVTSLTSDAAFPIYAEPIQNPTSVGIGGAKRVIAIRALTWPGTAQQ